MRVRSAGLNAFCSEACTPVTQRTSRGTAKIGPRYLRVLGPSAVTLLLSAAGCRLGRLPTEQIRSAGVRPTDLALRLFGPSQFEREFERIRAYLRGIGYGPSAMTRRSLTTVLAVLFVCAGRAELEGFDDWPP